MPPAGFVDQLTERRFGNNLGTLEPESQFAHRERCPAAGRSTISSSTMRYPLDRDRQSPARLASPVQSCPPGARRTPLSVPGRRSSPRAQRSSSMAPRGEASRARPESRDVGRSTRLDSSASYSSGGTRRRDCAIAGHGYGCRSGLSICRSVQASSALRRSAPCSRRWVASCGAARAARHPPPPLADDTQELPRSCRLRAPRRFTKTIS